MKVIKDVKRQKLQEGPITNSTAIRMDRWMVTGKIIEKIIEWTVDINKGSFKWNEKR